jgi:hypothetical protein
VAEFSIIVVPTDRNFIPGPDAVEAAAELMESFYPDRQHGIDEKDSETPKLVTARDGWDSLTCLSCGESVERWDLEEDKGGETWWTLFEAQLEASDDATAELVEMPCCGAEVRAGDLDLGAEAAFARFMLSIRDPGDDPALKSEQLDAIGKALGCEVRGIVEVRT